MGTKRLTEPAVLKAIARHRGNLAAVGRAFGVSRVAVHLYVKARPDLKAAVEDTREARVDNAETALDKAITKGAGWAVRLALLTLGKGRGYVERQEITGRDGGEFAVKVVTPAVAEAV